jgi:hypothetical protein
MHTLHDNQRGNIVIVAMAILLVVLIGVIGWKLMNKEDEPSRKADNSQAGKQSATEIEKEDASTSGGNLLQINARNTQRKNDAALVATAAAEYMYNNSGQTPTNFENGKLQGTGDTDYPSSVGLDFYTSLNLQYTGQPALTADGLALVFSATCGSNGDTTTSASSRSYSVQYMLEQSDDTFKPACLDT